jgi:hypothetical protein
VQIENRAAPHVLLGVLTLLSLGAIVLSLDTSPPNAQEQLRTAAANTAGATSFVLTDTESAGPPPSAHSSAGLSQERAVIVYQAPDRVEEIASAAGRVESALVVGTQRFEGAGAGKWYRLPPSTGSPSAGQEAASEVLFPLQSLSSATAAVLHEGGFRFVAGQPELLLTRLLGEVPPGSTSFVATVSGEFVRSEQVTVTSSAERITVDLELSEVGRAPALEVPPASQITSTPPG